MVHVRHPTPDETYFSVFDIHGSFSQYLCVPKDDAFAVEMKKINRRYWNIRRLLDKREEAVLEAVDNRSRCLARLARRHAYRRWEHRLKRHNQSLEYCRRNLIRQYGDPAIHF